MLSDRNLALGPLNLPVWLIAVLAALLVAVVLQRTVLRRWKPCWSIANDALQGALLAGIVVWKLTPLLSRFDEIVAAPSRLLYYPGGTPGLVAGVVVAAGVGLLIAVRRVRASEGDERPAPRALLLHAAMPVLAAAVGYLVVALIPAAGTSLDALPDYGYLPGYDGRIEPGRPTVVTVWATWCGPCTAQMPEFDRFHERRGGEVNLIALNLTRTESSLETVRAYLEESSLDVPVALDLDGSVSAALGVRSTPTTVVFDARGVERVRRTGAVNADWLSRRILPFGR
ncbi:MAG: TlpA family protein disulfide reductase [Spirochaetota bacterium]